LVGGEWGGGGGGGVGVGGGGVGGGVGCREGGELPHGAQLEAFQSGLDATRGRARPEGGLFGVPGRVRTGQD